MAILPGDGKARMIAGSAWTVSAGAGIDRAGGNINITEIFL